MPRSRATREGNPVEAVHSSTTRTFFGSPRSSRRSTPTNLDMALFLGTELTKMMIRMTVTESAPLRYRQGAKQWMVS